MEAILKDGKLLVAIISFFLGVFGAIFLEFKKKSKEKKGLLDLFITDINTNFLKVDELKSIPIGPNFYTARLSIKGINNLNFSGRPEYNFEVYNLKLFETEGFKLVHFLKNVSRIKFWEVYTLLKDIEQTRVVINSLIKEADQSNNDLIEYQKLFNELIELLIIKLNELSELLKKERYFSYKIYRFFKKTEK